MCSGGEVSVDAEVPNTLGVCGIACSLHRLDSPVGISSLLGGSAKSRASKGGSEKSDAEFHFDGLLEIIINEGDVIE